VRRAPLRAVLDTNVLVRLLVNDDPAQAEQAAALIDASA
jgi:predicted nucleic acid-binding protein